MTHETHGGTDCATGQSVRSDGTGTHLSFGGRFVIGTLTHEAL